MTEQLNERNFDRMVDGELDDQEQSRLLLACEEDPTQWRSLALAYIQAQTWRSDLSRFRTEMDEPTLQVTTTVQEKRRMPIARLLNVAAMLLLSLTVGFGVGAISFTSSSDNGSQRLANRSTSNQPTLQENTPAQADDEILVLVQNQQTSELQPMKVPLVSISDINTGLNGHHRIPSEVWRALQDDGHDVSHQRQWYPVRLNDGRSALVPIDSFRVMFEGFQ